MRVTVERSALLKSLSHAHRVVERRNTIPILANVLIEATADGVSFRATDLDTEVVDRAPAMVERPGATTVNAALLNEIARKLPDGGPTWRAGVSRDKRFAPSTTWTGLEGSSPARIRQKGQCVMRRSL